VTKRKIVTFDCYRTPIDLDLDWECDIMPTARYRGMRWSWVNRFGRRGSALFKPSYEIGDLSALPPMLGV
jgi:hypothetical protein